MDNVEEVRGKLWTVVTRDRDKALEVISAIETNYDVPVVERKISSQYINLFFDDGVWLRWVRPTDSARGYRHGKLWCDKSIPLDDLRLHILTKYFGKYENIVWF